MGRKKLEIPNVPISANVPAPLVRRLRSICATHSLEWRVFIERVLEAGLRALHQDGANAAVDEGASHV